MERKAKESNRRIGLLCGCRGFGRRILRLYLYANLKAAREENVTLLFSAANEMFVWFNGEFLGCVFEKDFAWHGFWKNESIAAAAACLRRACSRAIITC